ncbi:hypothetical protein [Fibrella aquatilis]|uniref:Uncharacterized protein n=1 Tax=Fibrella aquatilis TaxID=2817059 RepID=A0A939K096_9BACT|nr:hypothetical protein [Fibrella aquatilis]MBO0931766.1 hypothetical protein [Fibrella aquatilis]
MENLAAKYTHIKGWGIDADPSNDPTYPLKYHMPTEHDGYNWERPVQQSQDVEVLQSIERPSLPAVFGTSVAPQGLSGQIRRYAFKYSESHYGHWLPLLLADRVNMVEGLVDDLKQGHIPNIFAEKGWKAEWKYNPVGLVTKVATTVLITTAIFAFVTRKKDKR